MMPFIAALRSGPPAHPTRLLYLHREGRGAPYAQELLDIATRQPALQLQIVDTGDGLPDLDQLLPAAGDLRGLDCYLCGPSALLDATRRVLQQRGIDGSRIHFERFDFR